MAESSMPKRSEDDCDMVTSLQEPFLSKQELTFQEAARTNRRSDLESLLKSVKIDCRNSLDRTALHMAASKGHREIVRVLVENKASVELTDKYGMSPLMWATYFGHRDVVQYLIDRAANIKRRNKLGMHALHLAAEQNHVDLIRIFLSKTKRTILDDTEKNGQTALMIAAAKGNYEAVKILLQCEADMKIRDAQKRTVLHLASMFNNKKNDVVSNNEIILREILSSKRQKVNELVNERDSSDQTPIHYAVSLGIPGAVSCLLEFGANPNEPGDPAEREEVWPPVEPIVHKLISPFHVAASHGHLEILKLLHNAGADVNATNHMGATALHFAALHDDRAIVYSMIYSLVHMGCDLAAQNNRQQTPLHLAAEQNRIEAAEALLLSGAPLHLTDKTGKTPLVLATRGGCVCIVDMIIKAERHRDKLRRLLNKEAPQSSSTARGGDQTDSGFVPDGYLKNCFNINKVQNLEDEQTDVIIQTTGLAPPFRLREFNQPYAEEFKLFLWKLAFKHLRHGEWKALAAFWRLRKDHIQAIEQQLSEETSYKNHGYRVLCIWFHGIGLETPIRELYEALVTIGRRPLAEKVRQKLDRSVEYYAATKYHEKGNKRCSLQ